MTRIRSYSIVALLLAFMSIGLMLTPSVRASEDGRKWTTLGLGAATVYFGARHQWVPAAIAGIGTAVALHNWNAKINARHRREHRYAMRHAYRVGYLRGYRSHIRTAYLRRHRHSY